MANGQQPIIIHHHQQQQQQQQQQRQQNMDTKYQFRYELVINSILSSMMAVDGNCFCYSK
ncbi:hypothetical protein DERF_011640 [Dermatophagoides farinae]|uniref:Uncharacterized protein n=1 Tax=Dermatophagoides farinae TaxID=6954 RepID=A0A922L4Z5_DERFA|nr:hypothetical protein DERF_011640 [Dermatophagoides farinae]